MLPSDGPVFAFGLRENHFCSGVGEGFFRERRSVRRRPETAPRAFPRYPTARGLGSRRQQRHSIREAHSHQSRAVVEGLIELLALCGQAAGKDRPIRYLLSEIHSRICSANSEPRNILLAFGARPLSFVEAPHLYAVLLDICVRAGMTRVPELFLLPTPGMNAYALGGHDDACVSVTAGLLHRLSREEIAGIFAHEVAHVIHQDTGAMKWAAAVQAEIVRSALDGIAKLMADRQGRHVLRPQALFLAAAPALAQRLLSALSRARELAADSKAMDLIDHPDALAAALSKLEYFHTGLSPFHAHLRDSAAANSLRSHPGTWERIANLGIMAPCVVLR